MNLIDITPIGPKVDIEVVTPIISAYGDSLILEFSASESTVTFPKFRYILTLLCASEQCDSPIDYTGPQVNMRLSISYHERRNKKWTITSHSTFDITDRDVLLTGWFPSTGSCREYPDAVVLGLWQTYVSNLALANLEDLELSEFASYFRDGKCGSLCGPGTEKGGWFILESFEEAPTRIAPPLTCANNPNEAEKLAAYAIAAGLYSVTAEQFFLILAQLELTGTALIVDESGPKTITVFYCPCDEPPCRPGIGCDDEGEEVPDPNGQPPKTITVRNDTIPTPTPFRLSIPPVQLPVPIVRTPAPVVRDCEGCFPRIIDPDIIIIRNDNEPEDVVCDGCLPGNYSITIGGGNPTYAPGRSQGYCLVTRVIFAVASDLSWPGVQNIFTGPFPSNSVAIRAKLPPSGLRNFWPNLCPAFNCTNPQVFGAQYITNEAGYGLYYVDILDSPRYQYVGESVNQSASGGGLLATYSRVRRVDNNNGNTVGIISLGISNIPGQRSNTLPPSPAPVFGIPPTVVTLGPRFNDGTVNCGIQAEAYDTGTWVIQFLRRVCLSGEEREPNDLLEALASREFLVSANGLFQIQLPGIRSQRPTYSGSVKSTLFCDTATDEGIYAETQGPATRTYMSLPGTNYAVQIYSERFIPG